MKKVTLLGLYNSMATTIFGPMDILNQAGRLWNRISQKPATPFFDVTLASPDGSPIRSVNRINIQPHCSIDEITKTDLIIIASATYIDKILEKNPELIPWIQDHYQKGAHVASICTGVFLLAKTGLLNNLSATLHWGFADIFRQRYPDIRLETDKMFIDHGRLYCSAGVTAGMDLCLYLVQKFCGRKTAVASARTMVLDTGRTSQIPYQVFPDSPAGHDRLIQKVQTFIQDHMTEEIRYETLAAASGTSRRSLERKFKLAIGMTPLQYLQMLRVEKARRLLEETSATFSEITYTVGYEDISFFRKLFGRLTGLKPTEYRRRFSGYRAGQ